MVFLFSMEDLKDKDKRFLEIAIGLAEKARGLTSPNPLVGAVIVKNGRVLSKGYHKKAGGPHAEIEAINAAKKKGIKDLKGSQMYVSLEPCSIQAKTPPCTDAIIKEGFKSVIISSLDPNPLVNGKGVERLKSAGIDVRQGLLKDRVERQNEVFFKHIKTKKPFVSCKIASSIDGKLATKTASSKWITSRASREYARRLRSYYDCIMTGINTVIEDDPMLFYDSKIHEGKKYIRAVLDSGMRIPNDSKIVKSSTTIDTIVFFDKDKKDDVKLEFLRSKGIDAVGIAKSPGISKYIDLEKVLDLLYKDYGVTSLLVESGPALATSFLISGLIDKLYFFIAPKVVGGDSSFSMFGSLGIEDIDDSIQLDFDSVETIDDDILVTAYPRLKGGI